MFFLLLIVASRIIDTRYVIILARCSSADKGNLTYSYASTSRTVSREALRAGT